jgi:hypothetical protein
VGNTTDNFAHDPRREATASIRGYVYQVQTTILRWLDLREPQELELECGEDIDTIQDRIASGSLLPTRLLEQVKSSVAPISLRSPSALAALTSFWKHLCVNPRCELQFRYVTTAGVRSERASPFGDGSSGIVVWEDMRQRKVSASAVPSRLAGIRQILQSASKPYGVQGTDWRAFTELARRASDGEFADFIRRFEWSMEQSGPEETRRLIIEKIQSRKPGLQLAKAEELYQRLFVLVFKTLSQPGPKRLTPRTLTAELSRETIQSEDRELWLAVRTLLASLEERVAKVETSQREILGMLSQKTHVQGIGALAPDVIVDPQPLVDKAVPRVEAVGQVTSTLTEKTWCALVGQHSSGKTQLAVLAAFVISKRSVWVRLRDRTPEEAALLLDRCLELAADVPRSHLLERWYRRVAERLGAGALIVLDDLPNTTSAGALETRLVLLARACAQMGLRVISTSHQPLNPALVDLLGETVQELQAAPFSDEDIAQLLQSHGAPKQRANALSRLVAAITRRHALLVHAAARFLSNKGWAVDDQTLGELLRGDFAKKLEDPVRSSLIATTTDETRDLLYRLTLVGSGFTKEDVQLVAAVGPTIRLPLDKLGGALGLWVQKDSRGTYSTCALLDRLGCGLGTELQRRVHLALGGAILGRKKLSLLDGMEAFRHYFSAGDLVRAAFILSQGLNVLVNYEGPPVPDMGLSLIWADAPLPKAIPLPLRLQVRGLQIVVRHERHMDVQYLLGDFDLLLESAQADDAAGVIYASSLLVLRLGREYPRRANAYVSNIVRALPSLRLPGGELFDFPEGAEPENMLWITARGIRSAEDLVDWLNTAGQLPAEKRRSLFDSDISDPGAILLCDGTWDRERRKPAEEQDWRSVFDQLDAIDGFAISTSNTLLQGCVARARITVQGEIRNALDDAIAIADRIYPRLAQDSKAQFLVAESIAVQFSRQERTAEAKFWGRRAVEATTDAFPSLRRDALLLLSRTALPNDPTEGIGYAERAVRLARSSPSLGSTTLAETLGELAVALWTTGALRRAFDTWEEAVSVLLSERPDSGHWRRLHVVFGHCTAYFSCKALSGKPPTVDFVEPYPGIVALTDRADELYDPNREGLFLVQVGMFANALGLPQQAAEWGARGIEVSESTGAIQVARHFAWLGVARAVLEGQFRRALELAFQSVEYGHPIDPQQLQKLGVKDPEEWEAARRRALDGQQADTEAILIGLVPIAVRIAGVFIDDRAKARELAREAAEACQQLGSSSGRTVWDTAAKVVAATFEETGDWRSFAARGDAFAANGQSGLSTICHLGVVLRSGLAQSLAFQCHVLRFAEQFYWRVFRSVYAAVIVPFVERFWEAALEQRSFEFRMPRYTGREMRAAAALPTESRVKHILLAATTDLNLKLSPDLQEWLDQND